MLRDRDAIELRAEPRLSPTEQAVADDLVAGLTVREVAALRGFAESTAKTHVKNIYRKLAVASRVELVEALRRGEP
jgi:DNA-binding NarL/FixJ family response regulator